MMNYIEQTSNFPGVNDVNDVFDDIPCTLSLMYKYQT